MKEVVEVRKLTHAIGTWRNPYGNGTESPRDWVPRRGSAVHQGKHHGVGQQ